MTQKTSWHGNSLNKGKKFLSRIFDELNMSNHSLPAQGTDPPYSQKSVVSITHEENIVCSKTLICRQLFADQVMSSRPMKKKEKMHRMIICGHTQKIKICHKYMR